MIKIFTVVVLCVLMAIPSVVKAGDEREDIHDSAEQAQPLLSGMMAPAFNVQDVHGNDFLYDPTAMQKPLVLSFYRGGWCPFCNLHLSEMRHAEKELLELGFDVWFVSIDKPGVLAESLKEPDLGYTLFSDSKLEATRAFGLAFKITDELHERYLTMDIDLEAASGENHHVLPVPSTYIIGNDGVISFQYTNVNYRVRLHPDVLLAAARAYTKDADKRLRREMAAQRKSAE